MELEKQVWKNLPAELLLRVVEDLPLDSQCRFRSVCKAWRTSNLRLDTFDDWLVYKKDDTALIIDQENEEDDHLYIRNPKTGKTYPLGCWIPEEYSVLTCIDGLVVLVEQKPTGIVIWDLFDHKRSWKKLPNQPCIDSYQDLGFVGIDRKPSATHLPRMGITPLTDYIVLGVLVSKEGTDFVLQIFSGNEWTNSKVIHLPTGYVFASDPITRVLLGSTFYFLGVKKDSKGKTINTILCYTDVLGEEKQCKVVQMKRKAWSFGKPQLARCMGALLLFYPHSVESGHAVISIQRLDAEELEWKDVSTSPHLALFEKPSVQSAYLNAHLTFTISDFVFRDHATFVNFDLGYSFLTNKWFEVGQKLEWS